MRSGVGKYEPGVLLGNVEDIDSSCMMLPMPSPSQNPKTPIFLDSLDSGQPRRGETGVERSDFEQRDLLSPVGFSPSTLFPVLPSFDSNSSESWIGSKSVDDARVKDDKADVESVFPKWMTSLSISPRTIEKGIGDTTSTGSSTHTTSAGSSTPPTETSLQPPALRRYVSIPKIQLQFDDEKNLQEYRPMTPLFSPDAEISESLYDSTHDSTLDGALKRRSEFKGFACASCRTSKTKCEGGFPCMRCSRLGRECKREDKERPLKRQRKDLKAGASDASCKMFAKHIVDFYRTRQIFAQEFKLDNCLPKTEEEKKKETQCYRNRWCIRQYRHPGHCKHAGHNKKRPNKAAMKAKTKARRSYHRATGAAA